jgi:hypothetical protein
LLASAVIALTWSWGIQAVVAEASEEELRQELRELNERVKELEASRADQPDDYRSHVETLAKTTVSGHVTMIGQTTPSVDPSEQSEGTLSADVIFQHRISDNGLVLVNFEYAQGQGFQPFPVFTAPNGNPTGSNNSIETFAVQTALHVDQAYYRHHWLDERVTLTVGQYDPTAFVDTNAYANSELTQFIAPIFATNPTLEFGGTGNFYGFGGVLTIEPVEPVKVIAAVMEGDGDYREMFTRPWSIFEVDLDLDPSGREGTYRFFLWENHRHHEPAFSLDPDRRNRGWGVNFDQAVSKHVGVWGRYGVQDDEVAFFDQSISGGVEMSGGAINRPHDAFGLGYGLTMIGDEYQAAQAAGGQSQFDANEGYLEAYYRFVLSGDGSLIGAALSPDVQYITNAGGDNSIDPIVVYGVRLQTFF